VRLKPILLLGISLSVPATLLASEAHSRAFGPQSIVRVARPTLRWEVWPGEGSRLTSALMTINGETVSPKYDDRNRVLIYTPSHALEAGTYEVSCKVVVDDCLPVHKEWKFKVASEALSALPAPSLDQVREIEQINNIRKALSLPPMQIDPRLCAAAMAHTNYLARNGMTGHYENAGDPAFVGNSPGDRLDAYGFSQGSWEGVDFGPQKAAHSVQRLYDAPYHRLPFLQPGSPAVGTGFSPSHMTVDFGMSDASAVEVSPADGQRGISLSWHGPESPDPLAIHGIGGECGYPIVFGYFSPTCEKIVVEQASLETALGVKVPFWLNSPSNDPDLQFAAFVLPKKSLTPKTGYTVSVKAHTESGKDISRTWRFVTGDR
jgi:hypothetical protein